MKKISNIWIVWPIESCSCWREESEVSLAMEQSENQTKRRRNCNSSEARYHNFVWVGIMFECVPDNETKTNQRTLIGMTLWNGLASPENVWFALGVILIHIILSGNVFFHFKGSILTSHQCLSLSIQKRRTRLLNLEIVINRHGLLSHH